MRTLGQYVLLSRLASGTLGDVFFAERRDSEPSPEPSTPTRPIALKVIHRDISEDLRFGRVLASGATAAIDLDHPALLRTLAVDRAGAELFVATELAEGQPLSLLLRRVALAGQTLEPALVAWIGAEIAGVLAFAHGKSWTVGTTEPMLHCGLSPRAILVSYDGQIKLTGMAIGRARLKTVVSMMRLPYMAPELLRDAEPSRRSDVYSLGVLLYDAFSGLRIFHRATEEKTRAAIRDGRAPPLGPAALGVEPSIGSLLEAMMAARAEARPGAVSEIEGLLRSATFAPDVMRARLAARMRSSFSVEVEENRRLGAVARRGVRRTQVDRRDTRPDFHALASDELDTLEDAKPDSDNESESERITLDLGRRRSIARYQSQGMLSRSASSVVLKARDPNVGRLVALKVLAPDSITDTRLPKDQWISLFKREAQFAGRLAHAGLPRLLDAGRDGAAFFMAYEFIEGEALNLLIDRAEARKCEVVRAIIADVALALHHMHERGVVHCDVRASNIIIGVSGEAHLVDFSMAATPRGPEHPLLASNVFTHTPEYLDGKGYGVRSDQFALGMLMVQLLLGIRPFGGFEERELADAIRHQVPRAPKAVDPSVDSDLSAIAMRLLERDPACRFEDCGQVAGALRAGAAEKSRRSQPSPSPSVPASLPSLVASAPASLPLPPSRVSPADVVIVDPSLKSEDLISLLSDAHINAVVHSDLEVVIAELSHLSPKSLVVAESAAQDPQGLALRVAAIAPDVELTLVPDLPLRLVGPPVRAEDLIDALVELFGRIARLTALDGPSWAGLHPVNAVRSMAHRLGAGPRARMLAPLAEASRQLLLRHDPPLQPEALLAVLPKDVLPFVMLSQDLLSLDGDGPGQRASLAIQILAVAECYFALTKPPGDGARLSPRRAVMLLRERARGRVRDDVVEALTDYLKEVISALDFGASQSSVRPSPPL